MVSTPPRVDHSRLTIRHAVGMTSLRATTSPILLLLELEDGADLFGANMRTTTCIIDRDQTNRAVV
jgi:hypothetical protein